MGRLSDPDAWRRAVILARLRRRTRLRRTLRLTRLWMQATRIGGPR